MKVLLINTNDNNGGAAIACRRLMDALTGAGIDVKMLVLTRTTDDPRIREVDASRWRHLRRKAAFVAERLQVFLQNGFSRGRLFTVSTASFGYDLSCHPLVKEADVIHLHWINHGMLSLKGIGKLLRLGKPVIWTMHDLWEATGICPHPRECNGFTEACGSCPLLASHSPNDLSARIMRRKKGLITDTDTCFVGCSEWLTAQARRSALARGNRYAVIPNPIDTHLFSPGDKAEVRRRLGLPADKQLILFGAVNAADKRKGIDYLIEASQLLKGEADRVELVMCGHLKHAPAEPFGLKVHEMGFVTDAVAMADLYRAADLFVTPSLEENLPNMIMEAMACGTPCVGFAIGGIPEMITPGVTGYLAEYRSAEDLARGIREVLGMPTAGKAARRFAEEHYAPEIVAGAYIKLYNEAINV